MKYPDVNGLMEVKEICFRFVLYEGRLLKMVFFDNGNDR